MVFLILDTCTERLLAGVRDTGGSPADRWINLDSQGNHARDLLPAVQDLLEERRPDAVGVALGPGSFTGVRIGLASAKGLAEGWGVPLVGLDNLGAMASTWRKLYPLSPAAVLPVIDARKKKFYGALYRSGEVLLEPSDLAPGAWVAAAAAVWNGPVELSGWQGRLLSEALGPDLPGGWSVRETGDWSPALLDQMEDSFRRGDFLGPGAGPRYLRLSEAEENLRSRST